MTVAITIAMRFVRFSDIALSQAIDASNAASRDEAPMTNGAPSCAGT